MIPPAETPETVIRRLSTWRLGRSMAGPQITPAPRTKFKDKFLKYFPTPHVNERQGEKIQAVI
jgi:hypothetical protein